MPRSIGRVIHQVASGEVRIQGDSPTAYVDAPTPPPSGVSESFTEDFSVEPLQSPWYDSAASNYIQGTSPDSSDCYEYIWLSGETGEPNNYTARRKLETPADSVDTTFDFCTDSAFSPSDGDHIIYWLLNTASDYQGPASGWTFYIEPYASGEWHITWRLPDYPNSGDSWWEGAVTSGAPSPHSNIMRTIRTVATMNTIVDGTPQADGVLEVWVDGTKYITKTDCLFRKEETQKFQQFLIGPSANGTQDATTSMFVDNIDVKGGIQTIGVPTNFTGDAGDTEVLWSWDAVSEATSYDIELDGAVVNLGDVTSYSDTGLTNGVAREARVRALNSEVTGDWTSTLTRTPSDAVAGEATALAITYAITGAGRAAFYFDYSERSSAGSHTFYVYRTHGSSGSVSVQYATEGDTHSTVSGQLTWEDGEMDIKEITVPVSSSDLTTHDGLGEHRIRMYLHSPSNGLALHRGSFTRAYGVIDNDTMIASDTNAIFIDFDAGTNGTGTQASPYNNWYSARDAWGVSSPRYIYGKGTCIPDGTDVNPGGVSCLDEEGSNGNLNGTSDTDRLYIRNWPGATWTITSGGTADNDKGGFYLESGCNYTTFKGIRFIDLNGRATGRVNGFAGAAWIKGNKQAMTYEHLHTDGSHSSSWAAPTGVFYCDGDGPFGLNVYSCYANDVTATTSSSDDSPRPSHAWECYRGGEVSITSCHFTDCDVYHKSGPTGLGTGVKFCVLGDYIRFGTNGATEGAGDYCVVQGNLIRQASNEDRGFWSNNEYKNNIVDESIWVVGNIFENCGGTGGDSAPMVFQQGAQDDAIILNNIFTNCQRVMRHNPDNGVSIRAMNYNHTYNVSAESGWLIRYNSSQWSTIDDFNASTGFEGNHTIGDPQFENLTSNNARLSSGSPCIGSGFGGTDKGLYLLGNEQIGVV